MKIEQKAYAAGLIDGEGSIMLCKQNSKNEFRSPIVSMSNTDYNLILFMKNTFGGSISNHKRYKVHHKQSWRWAVSRDRAINIIKNVIDYMLEEKKVKRGKLILEKYKKVTPRNGKYTEEMKKRKTKFEEEFFSF